MQQPEDAIPQLQRGCRAAAVLLSGGRQIQSGAEADHGQPGGAPFRLLRADPQADGAGRLHGDPGLTATSTSTPP